MENQPIVSVSMITYKHEEFIKQAIEGVLMQETTFEFDLILADDCSPDDTEKIVREIIQSHPKGHLIKYFRHKQNLGMQPNGLFAGRQCSGKYIAICEGDDYWTDPLKLQKQVDFMEANPGYSLCFHEVSCFDQKKNKDIGFYTNSSKDKYVTEDLFDKHFIATCSIVFRNNIILPDWLVKLSSGDKLLIFLNSLNGNIKFIDDVMGVYRLHSGGISNTHIGIKKVYDMSIYLNLINTYTNYKYNELCKRSLLHEIEVHIVPNYIEEKEITAFKTLEIIRELTKRTFKKLNFRKS